MGIQTVAGATIGIATGLPATYDEAGFAALSYDLIGEVTNLGDFGREYNLVTHNPIGDRRTKKLKGSFNDGSLPLNIAIDEDDAGQIALVAAADSDDSYSFVVTYQSGAKRYFTGLVMGRPESAGGVDDVLSVNATVEIDNDIVKVAAP